MTYCYKIIYKNKDKMSVVSGAVDAEDCNDASRYARMVRRVRSKGNVRASSLVVARSRFKVVSTCPGAILLIDDRTGCTARVEDYTKQEWNDAFFAPSAPYLWPKEKYSKVIPMKFEDGEHLKDLSYCS